MADLWTLYTAVQSMAIAAMLLLYARYWMFQQSAGTIPRSLVLVATDGFSITLLVFACCILCVVLLQVLVGPVLPETSNMFLGLVDIAGTLITGESALEYKLMVRTLFIVPTINSSELAVATDTLTPCCQLLISTPTCAGWNEMACVHVGAAEAVLRCSAHHLHRHLAELLHPICHLRKAAGEQSQQ